MKEMQPRLHVATLVWWSVRLAVFAVLLSTAFSVFMPEKVSALTTVPTKMNFQGRLVNAAGVVVPDGTYNMRFRLYTAASSGTLLWTETREVNVSTGVTVTNGIFSVRLGDVTTLPASLFASGTLFFEVELPTPASATCATSSCAVWTEGAMTPRNQLATTAYAFNSETLDGLDSADFARVGANNTFTGQQLLRNTVNSAAAFDIQNAAGNSIFSVDTISRAIYIGSGANRVEFDVNGGVRTYGTAQPVRTITLSPEYAGAVLNATNDPACASAYNGILTAGFDNLDYQNYYNWTSSLATAQCYDVVVRVVMPAEFAANEFVNISLDTWSDNLTNGKVAVQLVDSDQYTALNYGDMTPTSVGTWQSKSISPGFGFFPDSAPMYFKIRVSSKSGANVRIGDLRISYKAYTL